MAKKRGKKTGRAGAIIMFIIVLLLAVAVGAALYAKGLLDQVQRTDTVPDDVVPASAESFEITEDDIEEGGDDTLRPEDVVFDTNAVQVAQTDDGIRNILLIGQDARKGQGRQRSDSMIICSINTKTNTIRLISLMRDMYVPIPGYSANRINAAYVFGGMDLLDRVIEEDLGIRIDGNVEVDLDGFIKAMTKVGNLEIDLTAVEAEYLNNNTNLGDPNDVPRETWHLKAGLNSLTPTQALAYARIRKVGHGDYERTERQRKIIVTAFEKVTEKGLPALLGAAESVIPYITTDMTDDQIIDLASLVVTGNMTNIETYRLPEDGAYRNERIQGMSVLVPDLARNSAALKEYIYG